MFQLPRLPTSFSSIPNWSELLQRYWEEMVTKVERQEDRQDEIIAILTATVNRLKRIGSHTNPTTIMITEDDGATASIQIMDHQRIYADGTILEVTGGTTSGLTGGTRYAAYYDDVTLLNPVPTYIFTADLEVAQSATADGRHFLGIITTPTPGSGVSYSGGGVFPAGSSVGGEV